MAKVILDLPVGDKLRHYRKIRGYTQMDVVREAHLYGSTLSESAYSKIEQGTRNIFSSDLVILKLILGFTYNDIFEDFEETFINLKK